MSDETRKPGTWPPGVSGNPSGRPKLPDSIKKLKKMNSLEFDRLCNEFMKMTLEEVNDVLVDPESPMMSRVVAQIFLKAADQGDHSRLSFILDRTAGPVKTDIDLNVIPKPVIIERPGGGTVELGARLADGGEDDQSNT